MGPRFVMLVRKTFLIFSVSLLLVSAPLPPYDQQAAKPVPRAELFSALARLTGQIAVGTPAASAHDADTLPLQIVVALDIVCIHPCLDVAFFHEFLWGVKDPLFIHQHVNVFLCHFSTLICFIDFGLIFYFDPSASGAFVNNAVSAARATSTPSISPGMA